LSYVLPAFVFYRGSIRWSFTPTTTDYPVSDLSIVKDNITGAAAGYSTYQWLDNDINVSAYQHMLKRTAGNAGLAITNGNTQTGLNVELPNYSNEKFQTTNPSIAFIGSAVDGSLYDLFQVNMIVKPPADNVNRTVTLHNFCSIGTDFGAYFFLNVPTIFVYSSVPTPV